MRKWNSTRFSADPLAASPLPFTASTPNQKHSRGQLPRLCDIKMPAQKSCSAGVLKQSLHEAKYFKLSVNFSFSQQNSMTDGVHITVSNAYQKVHRPKSWLFFFYFWSRDSKILATHLTFLFRNVFLQGRLNLVPRAFSFSISKENVLRARWREISLCPPALNRERELLRKFW